MKIILSLIVSTIIVNTTVKLSVYTESDCPGCMEFYVSQVGPLLKNDLKSLVDLDIVSYGNAETNSDGSVTCQHGENECTGGKYQNCAFKYLPQEHDQVTYMVCTESANQADAPNNNWSKISASCLSAAVATQVEQCATSDEGLKLLVQAGKNTPSDHQYVPWIVVNGKHTEADENLALDNLVGLICKYNPSAKGCKTEEVQNVEFRINHIGMTFSEQFLAATATADYEKPPCTGTGEIAVQISGVSGSVCTPPCSNGACNNTVPADTTAAQMCALQDPQGNQYCVLVCSGFSTGSCPSGASCQSAGGIGICTYA